jgi:hypothetical protein
MSSAYYAAFHMARRYVEESLPEHFVPADGRAHDVVWSVLTQSGRRREERTAGMEGVRLRHRRTSADYRNPFPAGRLDAEVQEALEPPPDAEGALRTTA